MYEAATIPVKKRLSTYIPIGEINDLLKDWQNVLNTFFLERYKKRADTYDTEVEEPGWETDDLEDDERMVAFLPTSADINFRKFEYGIPFDWLNQTLQDLDDIYDECLLENWDGYGAGAISQETYFEARKLLELIPTSYPMPEISPEPDGGIGFEWYRKKGFSFVISINGKSIITYAGLFGKDSEISGSEHFTNLLPKIILDCLKRLFSYTE